MKHRLSRWFDGDHRGRSSDAIALTALTGIATMAQHHPHDPDDLSRCLLLLEGAPEARRALAMLARESPRWATLVENWEELEATLRRE